MIVGGYGNFGARIARALAPHPQIDLLIGGRDGRRAAEFAASLGRSVAGVAIDAAGDTLVRTLRDTGVELLVHTAGPFQHQRHDVAAAAAQARAHYIDLADGRRFVCDFALHHDAAFRAADRCAVSGASTVPALSSAVVEQLTRGWVGIESIDICIAPAQTAPRGAATMAAVLSYCGEPVQVWRDGRWQSLRGWAKPTPVHFARLKPRRGALCDIPDLELFPLRYAGVRSVMFRAALEVGLAQFALAWLAWLRSARLIPSLARWARSLDATAGAFDRFGTALGGMFVGVRGRNQDGAPAARRWHIAADHNRGPEIPCMAAILLARRLAQGQRWSSGAQPCMGLLELTDFAPEFSRWGMQTDVVDESA